MKATLQILGCGNSTGVPRIGNDWGACDPAEPRNARLRPSVLVRAGNTIAAIDTGPDFRQQLNAANVGSIDGVIYTHAHSDHVTGIDELRVISLREKRRIQVWGLRETLDTLQMKFPYLFNGTKDGFYEPVLEPLETDSGDTGKGTSSMVIGDFAFIPFMQDHGSCQTLGLRIGDTAYSTDMVRLDGVAINRLKGIRTWIVDAAGYHWQDNPAHAPIEKIYALNEQIGAKKVYLTHLTPSMDYKTLCDELKEGYEPAFDGLEIEINFRPAP